MRTHCHGAGSLVRGQFRHHTANQLSQRFQNLEIRLLVDSLMRWHFPSAWKEINEHCCDFNFDICTFLGWDDPEDFCHMVYHFVTLKNTTFVPSDDSVHPIIILDSMEKISSYFSSPLQLVVSDVLGHHLNKLASSPNFPSKSVVQGLLLMFRSFSVIHIVRYLSFCIRVLTFRMLSSYSDFRYPGWLSNSTLSLHMEDY
jgi:hypothetical protein